MSEDKKELEKAEQSVPLSVNLSPTTSMDLSWLPEEERKELLASYTTGMLDIAKKAQELNVDAGALKKTMEDISGTVKDAVDSGAAITVTHSQTSSVGRTEVIMGNTDEAQRGKLSKSQTGEKDWTPYYIFGGIVALVLIFAFAN